MNAMMSLRDAILYRILSDLFGQERVIFAMSAFAVCGGELSEDFLNIDPDIVKWSKSNKCLFTIVDHEDEPKMVVEFFSGFSKDIDNNEVEHQRFLKPLLEKSGISYVTLSEDEFNESIDPEGTVDFCTLLHSKISPIDTAEA